MADLDAVARRHGISVDAVRVLQDALRRGGGRQAQFSHRELGGMGQWSAGGMTQIGDMFNPALKDKVSALCRELAKDALNEAAPPPEPMQEAGAWWPDGLGRASATGSQNGVRYACFSDSRRVAVEQAGAVTVYDSGDHRINGVSQQQGSARDLTFNSQMGTIRAGDLPVVG